MAGWNYLIIIEFSSRDLVKSDYVVDKIQGVIESTSFAIQNEIIFQSSVLNLEIVDYHEEGVWHQFEIEENFKKSESSLSLKFLVNIVYFNDIIKFASIIGDTSDSDKYLKDNVNEITSGLIGGMSKELEKIIIDSIGNLDQTYSEMFLDSKFDVIYNKRLKT